MFALLIIPLLVSGFIVLTTHPYHYYRLHRYDGQLLYMKAATCGMWCFAWTIIFAYTLKWLLPSFHLVSMLRDQLDLKLSEPGGERIIGWIVLLSFGSILISWIWGAAAKVLMIFKRKIIYFFQGIKSKNIDFENLIMLRIRQDLIKDSPMDEIFFDSLVDRRSVLLTLQSKKIYVGIVNGLGEPNEKEGPNQYISLLPIISGHRDKDTLKVILDNEYKGLSGVDTSIVVPLEEIAQVSWFNIDVHNAVSGNAY